MEVNRQLPSEAADLLTRKRLSAQKKGFVPGNELIGKELQDFFNS
jgi:hypothetical protein